MYNDPNASSKSTPPNANINGDTDANTNTESLIKGCKACGICQNECAFLTKYGNPGSIAKDCQTNPVEYLKASFECNLCGLCTSVCPKGLNPVTAFLEFRREAVKKGRVDLSKYKRLLNYEKRGASKKYSLYSLPENCDTIFFPGCTLTGSYPGHTIKTHEFLKKHIRNLGIVLDCCTKPSHDLGRQGYFEDMFFEMKSFLLQQDIKTIILACPSCQQIFTTYGKEFNVISAYEIISRHDPENSNLKNNEQGSTRQISGSITIHDPCQARFETAIQDSVRAIAKARGIQVIKTKHTGRKTFCCGEGAGVGCTSPGFSRTWAQKRVC
jgi:Fe-S oxidoreductase